MSIQVVPYNSEWPEMYKAEAKFLKTALGDNGVDIHHIGSTSIPGLSAKPKIDIIVVVKDLRTLTPVLEKLGYKSRGELNIPFRFFSRKEGEPLKLIFMSLKPGTQKLSLIFFSEIFYALTPKRGKTMQH